MRDIRFIAVHRGGHLSRKDQALLACWAADIAESVLPLFAQCDDDPRPAHAIAVARSWANGDVKTGLAMRASVAAHAAARQATHTAAIAAARAAGQAVATAHFAHHCMGALLYGMKALNAAGMESTTVKEKYLATLPAHLRVIVESGIESRLKAFGLA
jgi:hypothetical protein